MRMPAAQFQAIAARTTRIDQIEKIPDRLSPALVTVVTPQRKKAEYLDESLESALRERATDILGFALRAAKRVQVIRQLRLV